MKTQLPILVTVETSLHAVHRSRLSLHPEGFEYEILGNPSKELVKKIDAFLEGYLSKTAHMPTFLDMEKVTPFTETVLKFLMTIPFGQTFFYGHIAKTLGAPLASRAVGSACGRNPLPFFIPCHRVIASKRLARISHTFPENSKKCQKSELAGFSQGLTLKKLLLDFEKCL